LGLYDLHDSMKLVFSIANQYVRYTPGVLILSVL